MEETGSRQYAGSVPPSEDGGYESLTYFCAKPLVELHIGQLALTGLPIVMPEIRVGGAAVLVGLAKVRVRIARGVVSGQKTRWPLPESEYWATPEGALERVVAALVAPLCKVDYLDEMWGYGCGRGYFTIEGYGGPHGQRHNFHSPSHTSPERHAEVLDDLYSAGVLYLRVITSSGFKQVLDEAVAGRKRLTNERDGSARHDIQEAREYAALVELVRKMLSSASN